MKIKKVAIVGFGQFGRFMAQYLELHTVVVPVTSKTSPEVVATCDAIIFAVPYAALAEAAARVRPFVPKHALILDVTSVKQKPLAVLQRHFKGYQILGTHPIFGPQSGKNGIAKLPIVLCNRTCTPTTYRAIKRFLSHVLGLTIVEQTAKEHDHQMAHVQALTHYVGRALLHLKVESYATNTQSYKHLLELRDLLKFDSWDLFETIQNTNSEAKRVRKKFMRELILLEKKLEKN